MPNADLRLRVASAPQSEDDYRRVGGWNADAVAAAFQRSGTALDAVGRLLDFGCGCGRTLQYLHRLAPRTELHGSDTDAAAIAWCRDHLAYAQCRTNDPEPPLPYPDQSFDAIIALSVLSHLDAPMQRRWLAEFGRLLRPGGQVLISFAGPCVFERCLDDYAPETIREFETSGFAFVRNISDGLFPDWYQTSLQTAAFVMQSLPPGLRMTGFQEQGLTGWEDVIMLRRHEEADRFSGVLPPLPDTGSEPAPMATAVQQTGASAAAIVAALGSPDGQAALRKAVLHSWHLIREDTNSMIGLRSTWRSARFVERHIPLSLARSHGALRRDALDAAPRDGLFLEFGVFRGDWLNKFASWFPDVVFHGFDSFEGLPEPWSLREAGHFSLDGALPAVEPNVRLVKGWFSDTLPGFLREHPGQVSFIHMDCDLYSSTKTVLDLLMPRIGVGTRIVLDDFMQAPGWEKEEFRAFFAFIESSGFGFDYTGWAAESPGCSVGVVITRAG